MYDIIYDITLHETPVPDWFFFRKLWPASLCQVEGLALCLGHSAVELALPLNAAERQKLSFASVAGDQIVFHDGSQLPCQRRPLVAALRGHAQHMPVVSLIQAASFSQLKIGWDLRNRYSSHAGACTCCISPALMIHDVWWTSRPLPGGQDWEDARPGTPFL